MPIKFNCPHCGIETEQPTGYYNAAIKRGGNIYCSRKCGGLSRRTSTEQKKQVKKDYDKKYRADNLESKKIKAHEYFKKDYAANPEKYRAIRKAKYKKHLEYLQTPEYKEWKRNYDIKYLAKKNFGVFWESAILLTELENHLLKIRPDGIKFQMGITNKTQNRKRLWQRQNKQQKNYLQVI